MPLAGRTCLPGQIAPESLVRLMQSWHEHTQVVCSFRAVPARHVMWFGGSLCDFSESQKVLRFFVIGAFSALNRRHFGERRVEK